MVCLASSQGCPRHASNAGGNGWMKLPGSKQGFSSHPIVTQTVSSISSLKPKPPYLLLAWLPAAFTQESLWWCSNTDQWCVWERKGEHRSSAGSDSCSHPAHQSSDLHSEPDPIPAPTGFTGKTLWGFQEALAQQPIPGECRLRQMCRQSSVATCVARMSEGYWHFVSFIPRGPFSLFKCSQNGGEKGISMAVTLRHQLWVGMCTWHKVSSFSSFLFSSFLSCFYAFVENSSVD